VPAHKSRQVFRLALSLTFLLALLYGLRGTWTVEAAAVLGAYPRTVPVVGFAPDVRGGNDHGFASGAVVEGVQTTLGRGGTLARALERLGLPPRERHDVARALGRELDLTRLPASSGVSSGLDASGRVRTVALRTEPGRFVRWSVEGVEVVELPVRTSVESLGGEVVHSVRQALSGTAWADELTLAFADIFQWDVDLLVDPRAGDRVRIVYEVDLLDEIPPDVPSFGKAASVAGQPLRLGRVLAASFELPQDHERVFARET
jgi:hypothetical protein